MAKKNLNFKFLIIGLCFLTYENSKADSIDFSFRKNDKNFSPIQPIDLSAVDPNDNYRVFKEASRFSSRAISYDVNFAINIKCDNSKFVNDCGQEIDDSTPLPRDNDFSKINNMITCNLENIDRKDFITDYSSRTSEAFCEKIKKCVFREARFNEGLGCTATDKEIDEILPLDQYNEIGAAALLTNLFLNEEVVQISKIRADLNKNFSISKVKACDEVNKDAEKECSPKEINSFIDTFKNNTYVDKNYFNRNNLDITKDNFLSLIPSLNQSIVTNSDKDIKYIINNAHSSQLISNYLSKKGNDDSSILRLLSKNQILFSSELASFVEKLNKQNKKAAVKDLEIRNFIGKKIAEVYLPRLCNETEAFDVGRACNTIRKISNSKDSKAKKIIEKDNGYLISEKSLAKLNPSKMGNRNELISKILVRSCEDTFKTSIHPIASRSIASEGGVRSASDNGSGIREEQAASRDKNLLNAVASAVNNVSSTSSGSTSGASSASSTTNGYATQESDLSGKLDSALGSVQKSLGSGIAGVNAFGNSALNSEIVKSLNAKNLESLKTNDEKSDKEVADSESDNVSSAIRDEFSELRDEISSLKKELRKKEDVADEKELKDAQNPTANQPTAQELLAQKETEELKKKIAALESQLATKTKTSRKKLVDSDEDDDDQDDSWLSPRPSRSFASERSNYDESSDYRNDNSGSSGSSSVSRSGGGFSSNSSAQSSSTSSGSSAAASSSGGSSLVLSVKVGDQSMKVFPRTTTQEEIASKINEMPFLVENADGSYTQFLAEESDGKKSIVTKKIAASKVVKPKEAKRDIASAKSPVSKEFKEVPVSRDATRYQELQKALQVKPKK